MLFRSGRTFLPNRRLASSVCACCRVSLASHGNTLSMAWRNVSATNIRDIVLRQSSDGGATWGEVRPVWPDQWKIAGCPHSGPAIFHQNGSLRAAWWTAGRSPALYYANGNLPFTDSHRASGDLAHCGGAVWVSSGKDAFVVFHGTSKNGRGGVHARRVRPDGSLGDLRSLALPAQSPSYPSIALRDSMLVIGWTDRQAGKSSLAIATGELH